METQILIGKIVDVDDIGVKYKAIAEGMEWSLYSSNNRAIGDYVNAYVLSSLEDEDMDSEFYLEDTGAPLSNKELWDIQESNI